MKRALERLLANLFGLAFLGLSVLVTAETVLRKVFNISLQGAAELGGYALAIGSVIGFSLAVAGRNHIRVDVFHDRFPQRVQAFMNWLSAVALGLLALFLVGVCLRVITKTIEYGSTAQTPWATPLVIPQSVWYAALWVFAGYAVFYAARASWLYFSGRREQLLAEFHPKSAKEELSEELENLAQRSGGTEGNGR